MNTKFEKWYFRNHIQWVLEQRSLDLRSPRISAPMEKNQKYSNSAHPRISAHKFFIKYIPYFHGYKAGYAYKTARI